MKVMGLQRNKKAYDAVNAAILTAKSMPDSVVVRTGIGCAFVSSRTTPGQRYSVTGAAAGHEVPTCDCIAGKLGRMCWHKMKVLMVTGATEGQLLDLLGTYMGSAFGGFSVLYEQMATAETVAAVEAEEAAEKAEESEEEAGTAADGEQHEQREAHAPADDGAAASCEALDAAAEASAAGLCAAPPDAVGVAATSLRQKAADNYATESQLDEAFAAVRHELQGLTGHAAGEARQHVLHAMHKVLNTVRQIASRKALEQAVADAMILPNPEADMRDNSLARRPDFLEKGKRRRPPPVPHTSADAPPFLPPARKPRTTILAEITAEAEAETRQASNMAVAAATSQAIASQDVRGVQQSQAQGQEPQVLMAKAAISKPRTGSESSRRSGRERRAPAKHNSYTVE